MQENHIKPAVVLWLTFTSELRLFDAEKEAAVRNLTAAGLPVVVPAGFTEIQHDGPVMLDACHIAVANSASTLTVSTASKTDSIASGACHTLQRPRASLPPEVFKTWYLFNMVASSINLTTQNIGTRASEAVPDPELPQLKSPSMLQGPAHIPMLAAHQSVDTVQASLEALGLLLAAVRVWMCMPQAPTLWPHLAPRPSLTSWSSPARLLHLL